MTTRAMENVVRMGKENWIDPMEITTCHNITKHISSRVLWVVGNPSQEVLRYVSLARQTFWGFNNVSSCHGTMWARRLKPQSPEWFHWGSNEQNEVWAGKANQWHCNRAWTTQRNNDTKPWDTTNSVSEEVQMCFQNVIADAKNNSGIIC